jgi:hypothetical protein
MRDQEEYSILSKAANCLDGEAGQEPPAAFTGRRTAAASDVLLFPQPALQLIYDTAPIGLACLSPDCRYLQINQRLICGISVQDHLGRSVRECVPALADSIEKIVRSIMETGQPITRSARRAAK